MVRAACLASKRLTSTWSQPTEGGPPWTEVPGSEKVWPADLIFLATRFCRSRRDPR